MVSPIWKPLATVTATFALASAGVMLIISPAGAHTDLIGSDPPQGASLDEVPRELRLEFSDAMDPGLSAVTLQVEGGGSVPLELQIGANRNVLLATVPTSLQPQDGTASAWKATFRVVSRDGHPVVGTVEFVVRIPSPTSLPQDDDSSTASTGSAEDAEPDAADQSDETRDGGDAWPLVAVGAGMLGLLALAVGATMRLIGRDRDA